MATSQNHESPEKMGHLIALANHESGMVLALHSETRFLRVFSERFQRSKTAVGNDLRSLTTKEKWKNICRSVTERIGRAIHRRVSTGFISVNQVRSVLKLNVSRSKVWRAARRAKHLSCCKKCEARFM